jgi:hypothetical protein
MSMEIKRTKVYNTIETGHSYLPRDIVRCSKAGEVNHVPFTETEQSGTLTMHYTVGFMKEK